MTTSAGAGARPAPAVPAALLEAVEERCRAQAATASGRVFEVPEHRIDDAVRAELAEGARYDTILSFVRTPGVADLAGFVADLEGLLDVGGWILMVEPVGNTHFASRLQRLVPSRFRKGATGIADGDRDVVSALRAGGFMVTDLHRCEALSAPARWRRFVELRARRESPWGTDPKFP